MTIFALTLKRFKDVFPTSSITQPLTLWRRNSYVISDFWKKIFFFKFEKVRHRALWRTSAFRNSLRSLCRWSHRKWDSEVSLRRVYLTTVETKLLNSFDPAHRSVDYRLYLAKFSDFWTKNLWGYTWIVCPSVEIGRIEIECLVVAL